MISADDDTPHPDRERQRRLPGAGHDLAARGGRRDGPGHHGGGDTGRARPAGGPRVGGPRRRAPRSRNARTSRSGACCSSRVPPRATALLATPDSLLAVPLAGGEPTVLADGFGGRPAAPVRLGACQYGAWSGGGGTVVTACDGAEPRVLSLGTPTSDLVFRVNRDQVLLNDRTTGAVWNIDTEQPTRLDDWDAFKRKATEDDEEEENEDEQQGDQRPPVANPDTLGARPGRTTVLHPLDNDTAPGGRLLSIRSVERVSGSGADGHHQPRRPDRPADAARRARRPGQLRLLHRRRPRREDRPRDRHRADPAARRERRPAAPARVRAAVVDRARRRRARRAGAARLARPRRRRPDRRHLGGGRVRRTQRRRRAAHGRAARSGSPPRRSVDRSRSSTPSPTASAATSSAASWSTSRTPRTGRRSRASRSPTSSAARSASRSRSTRSTTTSPAQTR